MQLRNKTYSKLPRLPHHSFSLQRTEVKRLVGSMLTKAIPLAIAVVLTNLGFTLAQAQIPGNSNINLPTRQPLPSPRFPTPEIEPVRPVQIPALYEHPNFFDEGREQLEQQIDDLRQRNTQDSSENDLLTVEESVYWDNQKPLDSWLTNKSGNKKQVTQPLNDF